MSSDEIIVDKSWTLFLDRDGTINTLREGDYVKSWDEFEFIHGALNAIKLLSSCFGRIIVVTNQQGIGKKLMSEDALQNIHNRMRREIEQAGGKIDAVLHCPNLISEEAECRKPDIGMGLLAKQQFPEIDFKKSVMIGDTISDMEFAHNLGMIPVLINNPIPLVPAFIHSIYPDLYETAREIYRSSSFEKD